MKERTIMVFPKFKNMEIIKNVRNKYDPLCNKVEPHITLVFPFKSILINEQIKDWMDFALKNTKPFEIELSGISKVNETDSNYLFLNITRGQEIFINLNLALYKGILKEFKADIPYVPHMTIGKFETKQQLEDAYLNVVNISETFATLVDTITVEMIGPDDNSIIEIEYKLL